MAAAKTAAKPGAKTAAAKKTNLVIVESPAKARTISKFLGSKYHVYASQGHIRDLPKSRMGVDVENNFEPSYINIRGKSELIKTLKKEAKTAEHVYLATDPDREGEAISWHIANTLELNEFQRIEFHEITKTAIMNAIKTPRDLDAAKVDAQQARRVLDRLVGYSISPLLWRKVRKGLSAGRVQSVATRMICDREKEIEAFVPEEYWHITAEVERDKKKFKVKYYGSPKKNELHNKEQADEIMKSLEGAQYAVTDVKPGTMTKHAPPPFTTSTLQQEASRKLGFVTKRTMMIAQQLYEGVDVKGQGTQGLVTYIRTDSVSVAREAQSAALDYIKGRYGAEFAPEKPNFYKSRKGAQDAHECIRPTNVSLEPAMVKDSISPEQYKLYKLIFERFLASQMSEAKYETMAVTVTANGHVFKARGQRLVFAGFTAVYTEGRDETQDEENVKLPALNVGDVCKLIQLNPDQFFTQPPPRYTEASLVRAMEEKGIGRPSTYAPTIGTILERGYIVRKAKSLAPTELGQIVTDMMVDNFPDIVDIEFTARMEESLDSVEEGRIVWKKLIGDFYEPFHATVEKADQAIEKVKLEDEVSDVPCDKCGAMMVYKLGRYGKFLACPRFPECRNAKPIEKKIAARCPKCGKEIAQRRSKKGKTFFGCTGYPGCDFVSWDKPVEKKCPQCGGYMTEKKNRGGETLHVCADAQCKHSEKVGK